jgi:Ca2+-binding EF-hand superfamily protein
VKSECDVSNDISSIAELEKCNSKGALQLLKDIKKVEKIKPKVPGDDYIYRFDVLDRTLIIPSSKMLSPSMFFRRYLEEINELPQEDVYENWSLIVNALNEERLIVHIEDNEDDDETIAAELFLNVIRQLPILKKEERDRYKQNKFVLFCHNGNLYLSGEVVKKVFDNAKIKIKVRRLNQLIRKYKIDTGTLRYGKESNETIRCWIFSRNLLSDPVISINNLPEYPQQYQVQEHEIVAY